MDLSIPIIAGVIYTAYKLTTNQVPKRDKRNSVSKNEKFNGKNIYESKRFEEVNKIIKDKADEAYLESRDYKKTNRIPPHLNLLCDNDICFQEQTDSIKFKTKIAPESKTLLERRRKPQDKSSRLNFEKVVEQEEQKGAEGAQKNGEPVSLLTGEKMITTHNNMVPFYQGSEIPGYSRNSSNVIEKFTGNLETPTVKKEVGRFFDVKEENIYGNKLFTDQVGRDRYYQSGIKNNVVPTPQMKVKPLPEEVVRPVFKSIDELRVSSNQRETFKGRVLSGVNPSTVQRGLQGNINKNNPDTFYENSEDMYFTGSTVNAPRAKENFSLNETNRQNEENYRGPVSDNVKKTQIRMRHEDDIDVIDFSSAIKEPFKEIFRNDSNRNLSTDNKKTGDFGKCGYVSYETERQTTSKQHLLNASNTKTGNYLYMPEDAKTTQKELVLYDYIGNPETAVKESTNREEYQNYKYSLKEEVLDKKGYISGRQNQTDTSGAETINFSTYKDSASYDNYKAVPNPTYNKFNNDIGRTTENNLRVITETDQSSRIGPAFTQSLDKNPFSIKRSFK